MENHMKKLGIQIGLLMCLALCGCAVKSLKTSKDVDVIQKIRMIQVAYDPTLPHQIYIQKEGRGYRPTITTADKMVAYNNSLALSRIFNEGFSHRFSGIAAKYQVEVVKSADAPKLKISISSLRMACSPMGCQSLFTLQGELFSQADIRLWNFSSEVGQPVVNADISGELFDSFAKELLDAMKKDGIVGS